MTVVGRVLGLIICAGTGGAAWGMVGGANFPFFYLFATAAGMLVWYGIAYMARPIPFVGAGMNWLFSLPPLDDSKHQIWREQQDTKPAANPTGQRCPECRGTGTHGPTVKCSRCDDSGTLSE